MVNRMGRLKMSKVVPKKTQWLVTFGIILSVLVVGITFSVIMIVTYSGPPACKDKNDISIRRDLYLLCFNKENKQPSWVFQMVGIDSFKDLLSDSPSEYYQDIAIPKNDQASEQDYNDTHWAIGNYLFPFGEESIKQLYINPNEQYLFSVTSPQDRKLNEGYWKKLRDRVKQLVDSKEGTFYSSVGVFSGPLFLYDKNMKKEFLAASNLPVPTHFFQIIIPHPSGEDMEIYIIPNQYIDQNLSLKNFQVSMEKLETISGIKGLKNVNKLVPTPLMPLP